MKRLLSAWCFALEQARRLRPESPYKWVRYLLSAMASGARYAGWAEQCKSAGMSEWIRKHPRIGLKPIMRVYAAEMSADRRFNIVKSSFDWACSRPRLSDSAGDRTPLFETTIPDVGTLSITFGIENLFRHEAEFCVTVSHDGAPVHMAAFVCERRANGLAFLITASQGMRNEDAVQRIYKATDGIRPKALAVYAIQWMAAASGAVAIEATGNRVQARIRKIEYLLPRFASAYPVTFDYDAYWTELGGTPRGDGWFTLPLLPERRSREEIKANKRAQYARRYGWYDRFASDIATAIGSGHPPAASGRF